MAKAKLMSGEEEKKLTPQQRWNKKAGFVKKSYWTYQSEADAFKAACQKAGRSQNDVIREFSRKFVEEQGINKTE